MILGITPARGRSKGIPCKNIKLIAGRPLICWTIEKARSAQLLDSYVVSTEDKRIADVVKSCGTEVLVRPAEFASDTATTLSVLQHALKAIRCDIVVLLQATSPVRREGLIDECIKEFISNDYDSLATGFMCKYVEYGKGSRRRQDCKGFFYDDGNVYVIKADLLKSGERYGKRIGTKVISRYENIDIDDDFDFWVAERILTEAKF